MKLIVAGTRTGIPRDAVLDILTQEINITEELIIVSGGARGVDTYGEQWAALNNVDVTRFPADWARYGKSAGFIRNAQMGRYADGLFAFWDSKSRGTAHMIGIMEDLKKPVAIFRLDEEYLESNEDDDE